MNRFHVHLTVKDLNQSTDFYRKLFNQAPNVEKPDYAKWMLDDPRINFAISTHGKTGVNHFGFQADDDIGLNQLRQRAEAAAGPSILDEGETSCCYANSNKHWTQDPDGMPWEHFFTMAEAQTYENKSAIDYPTSPKDNNAQNICCVPSGISAGGCC